jgi:hypothetical protein
VFTRNRSLALASWALAALAAGLGLILMGTAVAWRDTAGAGPDSAWQAVPLLFFLLASPIVGALIVTRARPDHPIGWLFIVCSGALAFGLVADSAVTRSVALGGDIANAAVLKWLGSWLSVPAFATLPLFALLFPDGRPPSRRWTPLIWTTLTGATLLALSEAFRPEVILFTGGGELIVPNPFAIQALTGVATLAGIIALVLIIGSVLLAMLALVLRFRRSRGTERQQLKWFVLAMGTLVTLLVSSAVLELIASAGRSGPSVMDPVAEAVWILSISSLVLLPLSAGMAILRYRLYDIDVLINRALVYGALSATLLGTYVLSVLVLTALVRPVTGSGDIAVAGSTLAVLALFQPLRARIQRAVDRRFYRARYDAARTLDRFSARLREQVDMDALSTELIGVIDETIRPAHASIWIRGGRS